MLLSPRSVFFALREDDRGRRRGALRAAPARRLARRHGRGARDADRRRDILDNPEYDALLLAIWAFIAGGLYGVVGYFVLGFALYFGVRLLGSLGTSAARARPSASRSCRSRCRCSSLLPLRLALYGGDTFRGGGADEGSGERVLLALQLGFVAWSLALLVVGVACRHGWSWLRTLAALGAAAALLAAIVGVFATALTRAASKSASSSSGIAYVCCSSGKRRSRTSEAYASSAERIVSPISA